MDQDKLATDCINTKMDTLIESVNSLKLSIDTLVTLMEQRKDILEKGKDAMNNIHRIFGTQRTDMGSIFTSMIEGDDSDEDLTQTPSIKFENDSKALKWDNPFS